MPIAKPTPPGMPSVRTTGWSTSAPAPGEGRLRSRKRRSRGNRSRRRPRRARGDLPAARWALVADRDAPSHPGDPDGVLARPARSDRGRAGPDRAGTGGCRRRRSIRIPRSRRPRP
jgi:hypothetical protein